MLNPPRRRGYSRAEVEAKPPLNHPPAHRSQYHNTFDTFKYLVTLSILPTAKMDADVDGVLVLFPRFAAHPVCRGRVFFSWNS